MRVIRASVWVSLFTVGVFGCVVWACACLSLFFDLEFSVSVHLCSAAFVFSTSSLFSVGVFDAVILVCAPQSVFGWSFFIGVI